MNNNCGFYNDLDTNFDQACKLSNKSFTHNELIELLKNGNIPEKQIAALKFDYVKDTNDTIALLNNLTGCDGKIREAIALKINEILSNDTDSKRLFAQNSAEIFANATIDINANICRLVIDSAILLIEHECFAKNYADIIVKFAFEAMDTLDKFIYKDKKYTINKQLFKLYWCLEALNSFYIYVDDNELENILSRSCSQDEYTIREKAAQILKKTDKFEKLKQKLLNDENYYVREMLHH